jgi:hypothetical protein
MNAIVLAAAIGVSGTVVVGVAGFGAAIWNTRKTISQARDNRLWDQRAAVYIDTLSAIHYRQVQRDREMTREFPEDEMKQRIEAYLAAFRPPDWQSLEARLLAFATEPVFAAARDSAAAHEKAMRNYRFWLGETPGPSLPEFAKAHQNAQDCDSRVINLIRTELQGQGGKLPDFRPYPVLG